MNVCLPRRSLISVLAVLGAVVAAGPIAFSDTLIAMKIAPHISFAPADLRVQLDVTPAARNRSLFVVAESDEFYRSSEIPLDAEGAPRVITVQFRGLPYGEYAVSGEVRDADGQSLATARQDVTVLRLAGLP